MIMKTTFKQFLEEARDNTHLINAKTIKDDEFYTSYAHAEQMIKPFAKYLSGKSVLCNCDDPLYSQVYAFIRDNFKQFGLKKLVSVGYHSKMQIITKDSAEEVEVSNEGDFRKGESLDMLKACDVVVSNPPFSSNMFIDFIKLVMQNNKDVLAIGPLDGAKAVDVKPYLINESLYCIKSPYQTFGRPGQPKSKATQAKVAIFTTFEDDPFSKSLELHDDIDILSLPLEEKLMIPVSISNEGTFSIMSIPSFPSGNVKRIVVPLHVLRTNWRKHFKIVDILNTVYCNGKKLMSGIVMQYK